MPHSYVVKKTARESLKNNWLKSVSVCLIMLTTVVFSVFFQELVKTVFTAANLNIGGIINESVILNTVSVIIEALLLISLVLPLFLGMFRYFWQLTEGSQVSVYQIFYYFSTKNLYLRAVKTVCLLCFKLAIVFFVCLLPSIVIKIITSLSFYAFIGKTVPTSLVSVDFVNNWVLFLGVVAGVIISSVYFLVPAIITANEQTGIMEAFKLSREVAVGNIGSFITFLLSFAGWLLLSLLAFPVIYTLPYFSASFCEFSRTVIKINNIKSNYAKTVNQSQNI